MDRKTALAFDILEEQLITVLDEIEKLSKSKPDNPINKFKLGFINSLLDTANNILGKDSLPLQNFLLFVDGDLPSNSDVVFVLSQYLKKLDLVRYENTEIISGNFVWKTEGKDKIKTKRSNYYYRLSHL